jgi:hypothetical protein
VSDIDTLRNQAVQARRLGNDITDARTRGTLHAFAHELDRKAAEIERQQSIGGDKPSSSSRSDTR